jgi:hypothetical protein
MTTEAENNGLFGGNEFVFTKDNNNTIVGGGYTVKSALLSFGYPIMVTGNSNNQMQMGGKVSSIFENLAIPAGLFYINQQNYKNDLDTDKKDNHYKEHETISDDMIEKLFGLVDADKKRQRKTRKCVGKSTNNKSKTHKHH